MDRRAFIATASLAGGSALLASCSDPEAQEGAAAEPVATPGSSDGWQDVRGQFDLSPEKIHMSALLVAAHPRPVQEAIDRYRRGLNENPVTYLDEENDRRKEDVRVAAADYIGGSAEHVALTDSTTMGIALVYHGLPLQPGQEVLTTEHAYYSTYEALRQASDRTGARMREVTVYDEPSQASAEQITDRIVGAITPNTRALALTWVHSSTGVKLPLSQITEAVSEINAGRSTGDRVLVCVDGVHGLGVEDVTAEELGCDFLMAGCHKWLFGPRGTGIVWGRGDAWAELRPMIPSFMDQSSWNAWATESEPAGPTTAARMSPGGFKAFEHQWAMADAFAFHEEIGKARIAERTHALGRQLKEGLAQMSHVHLLTPMSDELSAGIVCFDVDGLSPEDVVARLADQDIIATTTPYGDPLPRLTPSIYNTPAEVETVLGAVRTLA